MYNFLRITFFLNQFDTKICSIYKKHVNWKFSSNIREHVINIEVLEIITQPKP